jgi:hypothetical protein
MSLWFCYNNDNIHPTHTVTSKNLLWMQNNKHIPLLIVGYVLLILPRLIFMQLIMHVTNKKCKKFYGEPMTPTFL